MAKEIKITKEMTFSDIVQKAPKSIEILFNYGMHCIGCGMAGMETLEQGALAHGLDPDKLVEEINNKLIKKTIKKNK